MRSRVSGKADTWLPRAGAMLGWRATGDAFGAVAAVVAVIAVLGAAGCAETEGERKTIVPEGAQANAYDDRADAAQLRARLNDLRWSAGRPAALPFSVGQAHLNDAKHFIATGVDPDIALEDSMQGTADDGERTVRFWCLGTMNLATFEFPRALLQPARLNVAIGVFRQPEDRSPRYLVLLATPSLDEFRAPM